MKHENTNDGRDERLNRNDAVRRRNRHEHDT